MLLGLLDFDSLERVYSCRFLNPFCRHTPKLLYSQTPTFNATPVVEEILNACRREVECTLYLDLGFNDGGGKLGRRTRRRMVLLVSFQLTTSLETLPGQGGTNSRVVTGMYKTLNAEHKQQYLAVYWYTAKDQNKPMDAAEKRRNCHGRLRFIFHIIFLDLLTRSFHISKILCNRRPSGYPGQRQPR